MVGLGRVLARSAQMIIAGESGEVYRRGGVPFAALRASSEAEGTAGIAGRARLPQGRRQVAGGD
jgi:hypothetical protein